MGDYALSYDTTRIFLNQVFSEKKSTLYFVVGFAAFFTFPFSICACVVASTPNAGFNVVLTAILNVLYIGGAVHVISSSKTPIAVSVFTTYLLTYLLLD